MQPNDKPLPNSKAEPGKDEWVAPKLTRMRAGDAEVGGNPLRNEGAFAMGGS